MRKLAVCALLVLSGCATAPNVVDFQKSSAVAKPKEEVWTSIIEYFASNNISIKTIDKDSGIVYAERSAGGARSMSAWASCGEALMYTPERETVDLNVFVRPAGAESTNVTVNAAFRQIRKSAWDNSLSTVDCNSLGVLEAHLLKVARGG